MVIERTDDEVIIRLPSTIDTEGLQRLVDYLVYKDLLQTLKPNKQTLISLLSR
jgi:hypothetical protein